MQDKTGYFLRTRPNEEIKLPDAASVNDAGMDALMLSIPGKMEPSRLANIVEWLESASSHNPTIFRNVFVGEGITEVPQLVDRLKKPNPSSWLFTLTARYYTLLLPMRGDRATAD